MSLLNSSSVFLSLLIACYTASEKEPITALRRITRVFLLCVTTVKKGWSHLHSSLCAYSHTQWSDWCISLPSMDTSCFPQGGRKRSENR